MSIRSARMNFDNFKSKMASFRHPDGTITSSRGTMEKVIHDFYSGLFDSHVHLPHAIFRRMDTSLPLFSLPRSTRHIVGEETYNTRSRQDQTRTPEEAPANAHQHSGAVLHTLPVGMQDSISEDQPDRDLSSSGGPHN
ncbi:unnamed protein product [Heligmosomoides polygyrus]|uniref:Uncharacterized protein n=1 Tax=Heligmosomoides polygyrus TaxID=6339 RepID=A0A183GWB7_HELPZ|nr:unnamed protein product [Heligmosomoides polygyrus]